MVKSTINPKVNQNNTMNGVLVNSKTKSKSKKEINSSYYQKNKEKLKSQRRDNYQQDKETEKAKQKERYTKKKQQTQQQEKEQSAKYYGAEAIKILMSFGEYTILNKEKKKLWQDFNLTLKNCQEDIKEGLGSIASIMKLEQVSSKLIKDYWTIAKSEQRKKSKSWNSLDDDEQQHLLKYWGYEKARIENGYIDEAERLEKQSQEYLKEIELAKFHEERGKIKCSCYQCQEQKEIQAKIKEQLFKEEAEEKTVMIEGECSNCYEYKKVSSKSGLCRKCSKEQKE